jgi:hypothetical protein
MIEGSLLPKLRTDFENVLGPETSADGPWTLWLADDDPDFQTINFTYPPGIISAGGMLHNPYLRPYVRLELGARSEHWPSEEHSIRPYAADVFPEVFAEPTCSVRTLGAIRTFWEKATLLHASYYRPPEKGPGERHSRHLYDLAKLYRSPIGPAALARLDLLAAVVDHKSLFFEDKKAHYETAVPGTLHVVPPGEQLAAIEADYRVMQEHMIFGDSYPMGELVAILLELEGRINSARPAETTNPAPSAPDDDETD